MTRCIACAQLDVQLDRLEYEHQLMARNVECWSNRRDPNLNIEYGSKFKLRVWSSVDPDEIVF